MVSRHGQRDAIKDGVGDSATSGNMNVVAMKWEVRRGFDGQDWTRQCDVTGQNSSGRSEVEECREWDSSKARPAKGKCDG